MSRPKTRTEILLPHMTTFLKRQFGTASNARDNLGLTGIPRDEFWRACRGDPVTPDVASAIERQAERYAEHHGLDLQGQGTAPGHLRATLDRYRDLLKSAYSVLQGLDAIPTEGAELIELIRREFQ